MNRWISFAGATVAVIAAGYVAVGSGATPLRYDPLGLFTSPLVKQCEEILLERFAAPSTYRRLDVYEQQSPLTADEWAEREKHFGAKLIASGRKAIEEGRREPLLLQAEITYDISNRMGVPLRRTSLCEYVAQWGPASEVSRYAVSVDGQTTTEWLVEQAR